MSIDMNDHPKQVDDGVDFSKSLLGRLLVAGTAGVGVAGVLFLAAILVAGVLRLLRDGLLWLLANNDLTVAQVLGWRWDLIFAGLALWVGSSWWVYRKVYKA